MNSTRKAIAAAGIAGWLNAFGRMLAQTVEHIYSSYAERAQMRLAPTQPVRRRMDIR